MKSTEGWEEQRESSQESRHEGPHQQEEIIWGFDTDGKVGKVVLIFSHLLISHSSCDNKKKKVLFWGLEGNWWLEGKEGSGSK